jgi:hypothetical protein
VKGQVRPDGRSADRSSAHLPEPVAPNQLARRSGEHGPSQVRLDRRREVGEVIDKDGRNAGWDRDRPYAGIGLRRGELRRATCAQYDLAVDPQHGSVEATFGRITPNASPWRRPVPAVSSTSARYRAGTASAIANTSPVVAGRSSEGTGRGSLMLTHGDGAIRRSRTAAAKMAARYR